MTSFDFTAFDQTVARMDAAFGQKMKPKARVALTSVYFQALAAYDIDAVVAAGQRCLTTLSGFPKIVDWLAEVATKTPTVCPADRRQMGVDELDVHERAAARGYEDDPCTCGWCEASGVEDKPLRFVPTLVRGDEHEVAFNPRHHKVEVVGHWAHGEELRRWYVARDRFFALKRRAPRALLIAVESLVGVTREPGEEG